MAHKIESLCTKVCEEYDADLIFYFGPVARPKDDFLIDECAKKKRRKNVILMITTFGGDAHAAYRIVRTLQKHYNKGKFYVHINSVCASAGTLIAIGADELLLSDHAELGPIDAQLRRQDEIGERTSGLTPLHALECLQDHSMMMFETFFHRLRFDRGFSTNSAAKIATEITSELSGALYQQIDPIRIAEVNRFVRVASDYGRRIERNMKPSALQRLLKEYPAHDFVIDAQEASELFNTVSQPSASLEELGNEMKPMVEEFIYGNSAQVAYFEHPKDLDTTNQPPYENAPTPKHGKNGARPRAKPRRKSSAAPALPS